jgi:DNA-binding Lrp family transcriptional regulator
MAIVHFDSGAAGRNELKLHAPMRGRMMTQDARGGCCDFDREVQLFSNIVPIGREFRQLMHYEENPPGSRMVDQTDLAGNAIRWSLLPLINNNVATGQPNKIELAIVPRRRFDNVSRHMATQLDEIDVKILKQLQDHARISNVELADKVGLSPAPCLRRVRALEQTGVIRGYAALVNPSAVRLGVTVFVQISLDLQVEDRLEIFEHAIMQCPEVLECYLMTGDADYLLRVIVSDVSAYERFLRDSLTRIESAAGIKSSFALKQIKYSTALPLVDGAAGPEAAPVKPPAVLPRHGRNVTGKSEKPRGPGPLRRRR